MPVFQSATQEVSDLMGETVGLGRCSWGSEGRVSQQRPGCLLMELLSLPVFENGAGPLENPLVRGCASVRKQGQLGNGQ